ncbi:protein PML-like isoform X2 [Hemicordylus capensis]|uniref:protein PML-like isoform X2 n=1 Tax=Hemicordylus capensis TaxID=884348 RepID=UPI002302F279|nr:protein PML-like isoform X2 [Hemicordylus capensis]
MKLASQPGGAGRVAARCRWDGFLAQVSGSRAPATMSQEISAAGVAAAAESASGQQEMDKEFQFLLCEGCQKEVKFPKLIACLHNLCAKCLESTSSCPICETPHSQNAETPTQDNWLFANLQAKLSIYQRITSGQDLMCDNCKKEASFWCSDCERFLCSSCFEFHQRCLKRESHEAKALKDLRAESLNECLAGIRKLSIMFCSNGSHSNQILSIYCPDCRKSMCCVCALLDGKHGGQHSDIQSEIQRRKNELQSMNTELKEKKSSYEETRGSLQQLVESMEEVKNETAKQIQQKVEEMVRVVQEKGKKLLAEVEDQHRQQVQNVEEKLQHLEGVLQRMASSERMVEKMRLYASDQEVMDMHLFIKESLKELQKKQLPAINFQIQIQNFAEVKTQLQALFERVTKDKEAVPDRLEETSNHDHSVNSPAKRKMQEDIAVQTPPKVIKTEPGDSEGEKSASQASCSSLEQPGTSTEPASGSSLGEVTEYDIRWHPIPSSESSEPDDPTCLDSCSDEEDSNDESAGSSLLEESNNRSENGLEEVPRDRFSTPKKPDSGQGDLVFFDVKLLRDVIHLVAVTKARHFSVMFPPLQSLPREDKKNSLCAIDLENFLQHLQFLRKPILVGYDLWSMDLPALVSALEAVNKAEFFEESICGFLDALPLIKEKHPKIPSYKLKYLDKKYFWGTLDDTQASECAKTVKDLCNILEINPAVEKKPVIFYSSLRCYASLQPLLRMKLLSRPSLQTLALQNVSLSTLQSAYQKDPENGLKKLCRHLNSTRRNTEKRILKLSKIRTYFQALPSAAGCPSPEATP